MTEMVIDFLDVAVSANFKTGALRPKSVRVLATNFELEDIERQIS